MRASEKLKALSDAPAEEGLGFILNVLPQIVAVVEAAEAVPMWPAAGTKLPRVALAQAIIALDEALS